MKHQGVVVNFTDGSTMEWSSATNWVREGSSGVLKIEEGQDVVGECQWSHVMYVTYVSPKSEA
jgi:hypothetical protein